MKFAFSRPRRENLFLLLLVAGVFLSRWLPRISILNNFDAVNYALSIERFDVRLHQTQPPGYYLYIVGVRALDLLSGQHETSLALFSAIASALGVLWVYWLGRTMFNPRVGWITALLLATATLYWFQGEIAAPYTGDLALAALVSWLAYTSRKNTSNAATWLTALTLGLSGAYRPQTFFYLAPLLIYALWGRSWKWWLGCGLLASASAALLFIPAILDSGGPGDYLRAVFNLTNTTVSEHQSKYGYWRYLGNTLITLKLTFQAVGEPIWLFVILGFMASWSQPRARQIFLILWVLPTWAVFCLLYPGNPGTILVCIVPFFLWAGHGFDCLLNQVRWKKVGWVALVAVLTWQVLLFTALPLDILPYRQVDNRAKLDRIQRDYRAALSMVADLPADKTVVIAYNYRHLQYYLPAYPTYFFPTTDLQHPDEIVSAVFTEQGKVNNFARIPADQLIPAGTQFVAFFDIPLATIPASAPWLQERTRDGFAIHLIEIPAGQRATWTPGGLMLSAASPETDTPPAIPPIVSSSIKPDVVADYANPIGSSPETFGVNGWWTDEDADLWQERYAELAPRIVRLPVFQQVLEPTNDNDNPNETNAAGFLFGTPIPAGDNRHLTYRLWFESLRDQKITLMVYLPYLAQWLSWSESSSSAGAPFPPTDLDEYAEFVRVLLIYLVDEIHYPPQQIVLEPFNEPDLDCGADPNVPCFWRKWQMDELAAVLKAAHTQAQAVNPNIRLAGPALCCRIEVLDQLMQTYNAAEYLDILTFHKYDTSNFDLNPLFGMARAFAPYGKPVYVDEYGNTIHTSNGANGALWHAITLGELWKAGLAPIQFSVSEWPGMHAGYNSMGLMTDWHDGWQVKPAYGVYVNFFNHLADTTLVATQLPTGIFGVAGIQPSESTLALWLTNANFKKDGNLVIQVENWPAASASIQAFDNLAGSAAMQTFSISAGSDGALVFDYAIPPEQSFLFLLSASR
jgi:hypothetical protein